MTEKLNEQKSVENKTTKKIDEIKSIQGKIYEEMTEINSRLNEYLNEKRNKVQDIFGLNFSFSGAQKFNPCNSPIEKIYSSQKSKKEMTKKEKEALLERYEEITGIAITKPTTQSMKITLNFLSDDYFILLVYGQGKFNISEISPSNINYLPYLKELNKTNNISIFLVKIIVNEFYKYNKKV